MTVNFKASPTMIAATTSVKKRDSLDASIDAGLAMQTKNNLFSTLYDQGSDSQQDAKLIDLMRSSQYLDREVAKRIAHRLPDASLKCRPKMKPNVA